MKFSCFSWWLPVIIVWSSLSHLLADFSIVAHRGGFGGPENTVANAIRAFEAGADILEIDLRSTADGVLVNLHDAALERTTNGTGKVNEKTWDEIQELDAGIKFGAQYAGEPIPRFSDMIKIANLYQKKLFVDIKEQNLAYKIRQELNNYENNGSNIVFVTWGFENELYRDLFPRSEQLLVVGGTAQNYNSETLVNWRKKGITGLFFWGNQQPAESIQRLHAHGMKCGVISGGPADVKPMIDAGLDYFSTDYVAAVVANRKPSHWEQWINQYPWPERPDSYFDYLRSWWDNFHLPYTDYDGDDLPLLLELACGTSPFMANPPPTQIIRATPHEITFECPVTPFGLREFLVTPLMSYDLVQWEIAPFTDVRQLASGRCTWKIKRDSSSEVFYKLDFRHR